MVDLPFPVSPLAGKPLTSDSPASLISVGDGGELLRFPSRITRDLDMGSYPGVTLGALANDTERTENWIPVLECLTKAIAESRPLVLPSLVEIKGGMIESGIKTGLQLRPEIPRVMGDNGLVKQFDPSQPGITFSSVDGSTYSYNGVYEDINVEHGVEGTAGSCSFLVGSLDGCYFRNIGSPRHTGFRPEYGWKQAPGNIFQNLFENLVFQAAQVSYFYMDQGGSGNTWDNLYLGAGDENNVNIITGNAFHLENKIDELIKLLREEWTKAAGYTFFNNCTGIIVESLRYEGCRVAGPFGASFVRAYSGNSKIIIDKLEVYECNIKSADNPSGVSIMSAGAGAGFDVRGFEQRTRSGTGWGTTNMPLYLFGFDLTDPPELTVSCKVTDIVFPAAIANTGFYPDKTMRASEGPTLDKYLSIGEYRYDKLRSRIRNAVLAVETEPVSHVIQMYGCFEDCTFLIRNFSLTADLQVNVGGGLVSFDGGFDGSGGATLYPPTGNTYLVVAQNITFNAHTITSLRYEFRHDPANLAAYQSIFVKLGKLTADGNFQVGFSGSRAVQIGAGVAGETYISDNLSNLMSARDPADMAVSPFGAQMFGYILEEELTLSGAFVDTTIAIPSGAVVMAVPTRVTATIGGATTFDVGVSGTPAKFAAAVSKTLNSTAANVVGTVIDAGGLHVRLTANGGNFTGSGKVRVSISIISLTPATS